MICKVKFLFILKFKNEFIMLNLIHKIFLVFRIHK